MKRTRGKVLGNQPQAGNKGHDSRARDPGGEGGPSEKDDEDVFGTSDRRSLVRSYEEANSRQVAPQRPVEAPQQHYLHQLATLFKTYLFRSAWHGSHGSDDHPRRRLARRPDTAMKQSLRKAVTVVGLTSLHGAGLTHATPASAFHLPHIRRHRISLAIRAKLAAVAQ